MNTHSSYKRDLLSLSIRNYAHLVSKGVAVSALGMMLNTAAIAEEKESPSVGDAELIEEVVVSATRRSFQNAIDIKRDSAAIVDALSAGDIGDIPSLSVAEALEGIPGATTHRLKGSGSQVSIRGLGPFLGFSTFNGREVTTGSADRSVNFQQFPSELINTITIYKTQQADLVEGGTSGTVNLQSLRPLDYGKSVTTVDIRGKYNEHAERVDGNDGFGGRASATWVDQFETDIGDVGVSIGYARFDSGNPEESYLTSSNWQLCDANSPQSGRCSSYNRASQAADLADNGVIDADLFAIPNSMTYRTQDEEEKRDAVIATLQWRPSDQLELNFDLQWSDKYYEEDRHDLIIADTRDTVEDAVTNGDFGLVSYTGESDLRNDGELYRRDEEYKGGGVSFTWTPDDKLTLSGDVSVSNTQRDRVRRLARFRDTTDYTYDWTSGNPVPNISFHDPDLDLNDLYEFDDYLGLRTRLTNREDDVWAVRFDGRYEFDNSFITAVKAGVRYSEHERITNNEDNLEMDLEDINDEYWNGEQTEASLYSMALGCADSSFSNDDFLGSDGGGRGLSWATFDTECVIETLTQGKSHSLYPSESDRRGTNDIDVTETIKAAYVMAEFNSEFAGYPISGNFGVRVVETEVESVGYRADFSIVERSDGRFVLEQGDDLTTTKETNSFTEFLPSVNLTVGLQDDLLLRTAAYRAMSRDNIESLGAGRSFEVAGDDYATKEELLEDEFSSVQGGNPDLEPLMSWNADVSLEWYANEDTLISGAIYYKSFEAQVEQTTFDEVYQVDGENVTVPITTLLLQDDKSDLWGFEFTAQHAMTYLKAPFNGLGVKFAYNYADTNFETQDFLFGDRVVNGVEQEGIRGIEPASIFGLSEHSGSFTVYWDIGPVNLQAITKYRDEYFQPNAGDSKSSRWIDDFTLIDLAASWKINDTFKARLTVQNLGDEPQEGDRVTRDNNLTLWSSTGPKWELGISAKF